MPTIIKRKGPTGAVSFLAQVRISGFKPAAKTFKVETNAKEARAAAVAWGETLEKELRAQSVRGGARADITQLTIMGLVAEYTSDEDTKKLRSLYEVERMLDWWVDGYGTERVYDFGVRTIRAAQQKLKKPTHEKLEEPAQDEVKKRVRAPGTVNRHLSIMRTCWNWGRSRGLVPLERVWPPRLMLKEPRGRTRFLSDPELARLLKAAARDTLMHTAILVAIATGMRRSELLRLTWSDVDFTGTKVTVRESKNGEIRAVHLTSAAADALKQLRKLPVVSPVYVFVLPNGKQLRASRLQVRWRKIRKAADLVDFRWHDLRHSCASILLQSGATLPMVGAVLGHKSPTMTQRYAHLVAGAAVTGHAELDEKLRGKP